MGTPYSEVYELFLDIMKEDAEFFEYRNMSHVEVIEIIMMQCKKYLNEACTRIGLRLMQYPREFTARDNTSETFELTLNAYEMYVIANVMFEKHIEKGLAEYKAVTAMFHDADVVALNPTTERKEYKSFVDKIVYENNNKIDELESRDANMKPRLPNYSNPIS